MITVEFMIPGSDIPEIEEAVTGYLETLDPRGVWYHNMTVRPAPMGDWPWWAYVTAVRESVVN